MCYHTKQNKTIKEVEEKFKAKLVEGAIAKPSNHINGFTYPKTPIITKANPGCIQMYNWGLVPDWAGSNWQKNYTLNARIETIKEKPAFKEYAENRCIIIVNGFYEWQHVGKDKVKFEIGFNNQLFAFAGLYSNDTYTIVTTEAKGVMREIHNTKLRMPFSLKTESDMRSWLHNEEVAPRYDFTTTQLDFTQPTLF